MKTEQRPKPSVGRSTGQGVAGNGESEGLRGDDPIGRWGNRQADRPERERTDNQRRHGRATRCFTGEAKDGGRCGVGEAGMSVLGHHGDPGKPSTANRRSNAGHPSERNEVARAQGANGVGEVKEPSRSCQGGRRGRSTDATSRNGRRGKGPRSAKGSVEKASRMTLRGQGPAWSGTFPTLYGQPPRRGEGAVRPSGRPGALGETHP